jgi:hypothetical protein
MSQSLLALHPTDIGLILSYKCQSRCAHCIYNCGPDWNDWMQPEDVRAALETMMVWPQNFQVHITGGEPFLNFPLLLHTVETAAELGIPRYLETNAGWAVTDDLVERRFKALRQAGLQAILISVSPFHAETIPLERTTMAIRIATEIFGEQNVMVYQAQWLDLIQAFSATIPVPLENYIDIYGADETGRMLWDSYGLIAGGRAGYQLGYLKSKQSAETFYGDHCAFEILYAPHSHFDLYGNFIPGFCGGLSIGDWHALPMVLARAQRPEFPTIIDILVNYGPYGLFEAAVLEYDYVPLPDGYCGKCHLCVDVRKHLVQNGYFPELQPNQFYRELITATKQSLTDSN